MSPADLRLGELLTRAGLLLRARLGDILLDALVEMGAITQEVLQRS